MDSEFSYTCRTCGQIHRGIPDFGFDSPHYFSGSPDPVNDGRNELTADTCIIDGKHFFVRGVLEVPIRGPWGRFGWCVWVSLSRTSFERFVELFDDEDRVPGESFFGWFSNRLPGYPDTLKIKTQVHVRSYPNRPLIELEPSDHPLAVEQHEGIDEARVIELLEFCLHPATDSDPSG